MNQIPLQNGEIPNIPMNTLAGISSLTELLPELPLPTPHPSTVNNKSLLYSQRVIEEARRLVANPDENLVPHLVQALGQTSTDHIELKDNSSNAEVEGDLPPLLQAVLACNPNVFNQRTRSVEPHSSNHGGISPRTPMAPSPYYQQSPDGVVQHSPYQRSHTPMAQQQQGSPSPYSQNSPYPQGSPAKYGPQPSPYPQGSPSSRYQPQESSGKYAAQGSPARHVSQGSPGKFHPPTFPLGHQQQNIPQGVPSNTCNGYSANQFSPAPSPAVGSPPSANVMSPPQTTSRVLGQHQPKAIPALSPTSHGGGIHAKPASVARPSAAATAEQLQRQQQQPESQQQQQLVELEQENQEPTTVLSTAQAANYIVQGGDDRPQDPAGQPEEKQRLEKIKLRMVPGGAEPVVVLEPLSPKDKMLLSKSRPMSSKSVDAQSAAQAFAFDDSTSPDEHSSKETRISLKRKKKSKSHREDRGRFVPEVRYNIISSPTKDSPKLTLKLSRTVISPKTGQQLRPSELATHDKEKDLHTTESDKSGKGNVEKAVPETLVEKALEDKINEDKASDSTGVEKAATGAAEKLKEAIIIEESKSKEGTSQKSNKKEMDSLQDFIVSTEPAKVKGRKLDPVEQKKLQENDYSTAEVEVVGISDSPASPKVPMKTAASKTRCQGEKIEASASEDGTVGTPKPHMTRRSLTTSRRDPVAVVMLERLGPGNDMYSNIKSKRRRGMQQEEKSEEMLHIVEALVPNQEECAVRSREKSNSSSTAHDQDHQLDMDSGAKSKAKKRKHSDGQEGVDIMDLENFRDPFEDMYSSIKNKRRRKASANALKAMEIGNKDEDSSGEVVVSRDREERTAAVMEEVARQRKEKRKRREKREQAKPQLTMEELMESSTFKRFTSLMDSVFESSEDMDLDVDADDDDDEIPADSLIAKAVLTELCGEAAKLKSMGVMNQVAADRLVRLMNILERNIRDGAKLQPLLAQEEGGEEEQRLWRELTFERVIRSADSCLTALFITTSAKMPKQVFIEDTIERLVMYAKFHLQNTIYPEFDPVYRTPDNKDGIVWNSRMKRAHHKGARHKSVVSLYNKLCEIVSLLAELLEVEMMTDTVILQVSSLATTPFFVENVSELQLSALKLVMAVFSRYDKHRQLILEDIFASLAKLPSSKRNLRSYRLNSEDNIQMVTALVLSLIQCVVTLPEPEHVDSTQTNKDPEKTKEDKKSKESKMDDDVLIASSYETAMRTAQNFLSIFLKKCTSKEEEDYRPLFENFVQDLLATVNKPEWPAAELLLSLLGRLLVHHFSNRSTEMSLRVSSLDYLGMVAARLRKDAVSSELDQDTLDAVMDEINSVSESESVPVEKDEPTSPAFPDGDQTQTFQRAMLDYLAENSDTDPALHFARQFYIAQWYRDSTAQIERSIKGLKSKGAEDDSDNEVEEEDEDEDEDDGGVKKQNMVEPVSSVDVMQAADSRKKFLLTMVQASCGPLGTLRTRHSNLSYENACVIARYLASQRPFSQSFDIYLQQILRVLSENAIAVRTRAMKCLTAVVAVDPGILARADMQKGVHGRFMDQSTSVREAALELVGKFVLLRTELIPQYYDMIIERILDTGISVRKRVIKILRDICLEVPDFTKVTEMCVKMIRRVNDEEGIKKLVNDVFQQMWFSPVKSSDEESLFRKVINITDVVDACKETGYDWFEQLLSNLLKAEENASYKPASKACVQITDCLVQNVLSLEEKTAETVENRTSSHRLVSSLQTLYLFSKVRPELLVDHAMTLQPYLSTQCSTQGDYLVLHNVARILQLVVPLMEHPSEVFLASLEEDLMKLIIKHGMMILQACVSCLAAVVNNVTHNIRLVWDCFQKYFGVLGKLKQEYSMDPESQALQQNRPTLLRSLFTVGLLCKHFDFDRKMKGHTKVCIKDKVFEVLMYFMDHPDEAVQHKALTGIGFLSIQHPDLMMGSQMTKMYHKLLMENSSVKLKCQVLRNLQNYLTEEDAKLRVADAEWSKNAKKEDLKEMGDVSSGMGSSIMQIYLKHVMETFFHSETSVRMAALHVIVLVLKQGLVHPVQCVPYLVAMGTDQEMMVRNKADQQLSEIDHKYSGFIHMKALAGIKMSFKLQQIAQQNGDCIVRGMREDENRSPTALCSHLYSLVRCNRQHRRALLLSLLKLFDDETCQLDILLYVADNLACFPYATQDEPLFIIHHVDIILSVTGANVLQSFREALHPTKKATNQSEGADDEPGSPILPMVDDDDLEEDQLLAQFPSDPKALLDCCIQAHGCILLLMLKQYLKDLYGFTDSKCHRYSPTEAAKVYDKSLNRRSLAKFSPQSVLDYMCADTPDFAEDEGARRHLIEHYLDFKQLMLRLDPAEDDDEMPERESTTLSRTKITPTKEGNSINDKGTEAEDNQGQETEVEGKEGSGTKAEGQVSEKSSAVLKSRRGRPPKEKTTPKPAKRRQRRKRRRVVTMDSDDDDEEGDSSDPDFML
ncbi:nipped-B-like protein A isoform X2 [Branchiostoma floridae x Branchiostoma japonicum]